MENVNPIRLIYFKIGRHRHFPVVPVKANGTAIRSEICSDSEIIDVFNYFRFKKRSIIDKAQSSGYI